MFYALKTAAGEVSEVGVVPVYTHFLWWTHKSVIVDSM